MGPPPCRVRSLLRKRRPSRSRPSRMLIWLFIQAAATDVAWLRPGEAGRRQGRLGEAGALMTLSGGVRRGRKEEAAQRGVQGASGDGGAFGGEDPGGGRDPTDGLSRTPTDFGLRIRGISVIPALSARALYPVDLTTRKNIVALSATVYLKGRWTAGRSIGNRRHRLRVSGKQNDNIIRLRLSRQQ
jgi:hypothetical protein